MARRISVVIVIVSAIITMCSCGGAAVSTSPQTTVSAAALTVAPDQLPIAVLSQSYDVTLTASGGKGPYTWKVASGTLPAGLSLASESGLITGVPQQEDTRDVTLAVSDASANTARQNYTIRVRPRLAIATSGLPTGTANASYSATLAATGGLAPYTWAISSGSLPSGLSLDASSGALTGTTTQTGTFAFTVQVTDSAFFRQTASKSFSVVIQAAAAQQSVSIQTSSLADGTVGKAYTATLSATGGTQPYSWTLVSGPLPTGLTLSSSGTVSGTPTASGNYSFSVQASDASNPMLTAIAVITLFVNSAAVSSNVPLTSCGVLNQANATYVLQNDVSSPETCFSVQADNVTLDLNGHTITYGTNPPTTCSDSVNKRTNIACARYGIASMPSWDTEINYGRAAGAPTGHVANGLTIYGGNIVQGSAAGDYSAPIHTYGVNNLTIHDMDLTWTAKSGIGFNIAYAAGALTLYKNTFHNNVTDIYNRQALEGNSMRLGPSTSVSSADVHDNTILGGAQCGMTYDGDNGHFYNNDIALNATFTNDFAIYTWSQNGKTLTNEIDHNSIHNTYGRGIHAEGKGERAIIHDNTIDVIENPKNIEYNGCQLGGVYGIQLETGAYGEVYNNTITARADACDAVGFKFTSDDNATNPSGNIHSNTVHAVRQGTGSGLAFAVRTNNLAYPVTGLNIYDNDFYADTAVIGDEWANFTYQGGLTITGGTLNKGSNPDPSWYLVGLWSGSAQGLGCTLVNPTFGPGLSSGSPVHWDFHSPAENFTVAWSYKLTTTPGATITIADAQGNGAFSGLSDGNGQITAVLKESFQTAIRGNGTTTTYNPYSVLVTKSGCTSASFSTSVSGPTTDTRSLTCQ